MKNFVLTLSSIAILSLVACGGSSTPGKQAVTPRKQDVGTKVTKSAGGGLKAKDGDPPPVTKKGG